MSSAPKSLTRAEAMTLLSACDKYTDAKLAKMDKLDDEDFEDMIMPLATSLMKKTKAPAKVQLSAEQKAKIVLDNKISYLKSLINPDYVGKYSSKTIAEEMELLPPLSVVYLTEEAVATMGKVAVKKLHRCKISKMYIDEENTDAAAYKTSLELYEERKNLVQNAAYSYFLDELYKKPNRFTCGNMKINAAGKIEKMGGKQEKTADELEGEIQITNTKGKLETKILQKNDPINPAHHHIRKVEGIEDKILLRMKNCSSCSNQTAITEYTTPYDPSTLRKGGCNHIAFIKDVGEFMVEKTGDTTYKKIKQADALKLMPCFRVCNNACKDGSSKCGNHIKPKKIHDKVLKIATEVNFAFGDSWSAENSKWYETY